MEERPRFHLIEQATEVSVESTLSGHIPIIGRQADPLVVHFTELLIRQDVSEPVRNFVMAQIDKLTSGNTNPNFKAYLDYLSKHPQAQQADISIMAQSIGTELGLGCEPHERAYIRLQTIIEKIQEFYRENTTVHLPVFEIAQHIKDCYVNLHLLPEREYKEKSRNTLQEWKQKEMTGAWEEIHRVYQKVDLRSRFDGSVNNSKYRFVVVGRPGVGKTTFTKYITYECSKIEQERLWPQFKAVFKIPLRFLAVYKTLEDKALEEIAEKLQNSTQQDKHTLKSHIHLADFIHSTLKNDGLEPLKLTVEDITRLLIEASHNSAIKLLYLLDGLDEVAHLLQASHSLSNLLIDLLHQPYYILSTRPYALTQLPNNIQINSYYELMGFINDDIPHYITKVFVLNQYPDAEVQARKLATAIRNNKRLQGACHVPINLAFLCVLFQATELRHLDKYTLTQLYERLIDKLIYRYVEEQWGFKISSLALENRIKIPLLDFMGELALHALLNDKLVIQRHDLLEPLIVCHRSSLSPLLETLQMYATKPHSKKRHKKNHKSRKQWGKNQTIDQIIEKIIYQVVAKSGFLHQIRATDIKDELYYFIHFTFEEYLAAYVIARWFIGQYQPKLCFPYTTPEALLEKMINDRRYEVVAIFIAGHLAVNPSQKEDLLRYLKFLSSNYIYHYDSWSYIIIRCLEEAKLPDGKATRQLLKECQKKINNKINYESISDKPSYSELLSLETCPSVLRSIGTRQSLDAALEKYRNNQNKKSHYVSLLFVRNRLDAAVNNDGLLALIHDHTYPMDIRSEIITMAPAFVHADEKSTLMENLRSLYSQERDPKFRVVVLSALVDLSEKDKVLFLQLCNFLIDPQCYQIAAAAVIKLKQEVQAIEFCIAHFITELSYDLTLLFRALDALRFEVLKPAIKFPPETRQKIVDKIAIFLERDCFLSKMGIGFIDLTQAVEQSISVSVEEFLVKNLYVFRENENIATSMVLSLQPFFTSHINFPELMCSVFLQVLEEISLMRFGSFQDITKNNVIDYFLECFVSSDLKLMRACRHLLIMYEPVYRRILKYCIDNINHRNITVREMIITALIQCHWLYSTDTEVIRILSSSPRKEIEMAKSRIAVSLIENSIFYKIMRNEVSSPLKDKQIRIVFVGPGAIGKSAIVTRFVRSSFPGKFDPTIEDSYPQLIDFENQPYRLDIMDTAGSDGYQSLVSDYVKTGQAFVMVYSVTTRTSINGLLPWWQSISRDKSFVDDWPKILVGNKLDLEEERAVATSEGFKFALRQGMAFVECSAKTDTNIQWILHSVIRLVRYDRFQMDLVQQYFPAKIISPPKSISQYFCLPSFRFKRLFSAKLSTHRSFSQTKTFPQITEETRRVSLEVKNQPAHAHKEKPQSKIHLLAQAKKKESQEFVSENIIHLQRYTKALQVQRELSIQLNVSLSDYQILQNFKDIASNDSEFSKKKELYEVTSTLLDIHQLLLSANYSFPCEENKDRAYVNNIEYFAIINDSKITFTEEQVEGDGWCTLRAVGVEDPEMALDQLGKNLDKPYVHNFLVRAIENNVHAISLGEKFNSNDAKNRMHILELVQACYEKVQATEVNSPQHRSIYHEFLTHLNRPEVLRAYLIYLKKERYVDENIAAACLYLQGKKLVAFHDYLRTGRLMCTADEFDQHDSNTICIIFHPNSTQSEAHYNILKIQSIVPVNIATPTSGLSLAEISNNPYMKNRFKANTAETTEQHSPDFARSLI